MENSQLPTYSFFQKAFLIKPEEKIGRTTYTVRILLLWIIQGICAFNMASIYLWILMIFWFKLWSIVGLGLLFTFIYIMLVQMYKRVNDFQGSKVIFGLVVLILLYALLSLPFGYDIDPRIGTPILAYTIWISTYNTPKEKSIEETQNATTVDTVS